MNNISLLIAGIISIYTFNIIDIDGGTIGMSQFQGKKILIVNTASGSKYVNQFTSLEQLYQKYKDSLAIIAIPSNDFGNEKGPAMGIKTLVNTKFNIHYILAGKQVVSGPGISPLYRWLSNAAQNGTVEEPVLGDFCKYLLNGKGNIIGVFSGVVDPMDSVIQNAVRN